MRGFGERWWRARRRDPRSQTESVSDGGVTDLPYGVLMTIQAGTMASVHRGLPMLKNPFDLALYPMLLERVGPRTIIEIGTHRGGSAVWFADRWPEATVLSVDVERVEPVDHPRVRLLVGDARNLAEVLTVELMESIERPLLVIEDSDHRAGTVGAVLEFFDPWMREGEYLVVEDGILAAMGVSDDYDGGPLSAIHDFLASSGGRYAVDREYCDFFGRNVTWNVDGYLRRTAVP